MTATTEQLNQLRQAVLGNRRGREVEVEPTGEIHLPGDNGDGDHDLSDTEPQRLTKMSPHIFSIR